MRYIPRNQIKLPDGWEQRAEAALREVAALPPSERADAIGRHADIWGDLKDALKALSHGKCWYCERTQDRSDNAVDHFRPKGRVAECPGHPGYWWLAFDWRNYRFSCTYCNSRRIDRSTGSDGGKQDHFPLLDGCDWARSPSDKIDDERPCLLDPTCPQDAIVLWFQADGSVAPRHPDVPTLCKRAETSVWLYHLDHPAASDRRIVLYRDIRDLVARGDRSYKEYLDRGGVDCQAYELVLGQLMAMVSQDAEYSAAARDYVSGMRSDHPWVEAVLARA